MSDFITNDEEMRSVIEIYANECSRAPKRFMREFDNWLKEHDKKLEATIKWEQEIALINGEQKSE